MKIENGFSMRDVPSFTGANRGSDREALIICGCFGGAGRASSAGLRGFTTSHFTRTLKGESFPSTLNTFDSSANLRGPNLSGSIFAIAMTLPNSSSSNSR